MKGKVSSLYFGMPNLGRLRSRIENAPKTLTSDLRTKLGEIIIETLNKNSLDIKAQFIEYINSREDLKFKTPAHRTQVMNLFSGIFDSVFAGDINTLNTLVGDDKNDDEPAEAQAETPEAPADTPEAPAETPEAPANDEFED